MSAPKEPFYDERISPLMAQIIALCKEARINMAAQFSLGTDTDNDKALWCTTVLHDLDPDDVDGIDRMRKLRSIMYPPSELIAITIIGGG